MDSIADPYPYGPDWFSKSDKLDKSKEWIFAQVLGIKVFSF